jgi:3-oxoacyl-[acyl-carrier protein] reductase
MAGNMGRISVVTGGASGIGREIALRLARDNCIVVICDIDEKKAEQTAAEVRALGSKSLAVRCDVSRSTDVKRAVERTVTEFGKVEILVNNAGIGYATGSVDDPTHTLIENLTEEEWDRVLNVNLKSVFLFSRAVTPLMKRQMWGKIVSISSVAGITGHGIDGGSGPAYGVSKAGIINLTKTLARQLGPYNVNVNCVAPGSVPETAFTMTKEEVAGELALLPLKRMGRTLDIAEAVAFLCSEAAEWITGQTLSVNGGEVM